MERFEHGGDTFGLTGVIDFSSSLNPLGMPDAARTAFLGCVDACMVYPDPFCRNLTDAIAAAEQVDSRMVLACAGATDAFTRVCRSLRPRRALLCAPGYVGYEQILSQSGTEVSYAALLEEEGFAAGPSLADALDASIDVVFVANPNNPSGRCMRPEAIELLLRRALGLGTTVVLDECFVDLSDYGDTSTRFLADYPNLLIVKALTKTYALAGLRVGYVLCSDAALLARLDEMGQPWSVSVPAQVVGEVCLREGPDFLERSRALIRRERYRLEEALRHAGMQVVPSEANYLLWRARQDLCPSFLDQGILVRSCANFVGLDERWHRSAVRTPGENDVFIAALGKVVS